MSRQSDAALHGLVKGRRVIVLTCDRRKRLDDHAGIERRLYLYETGAEFAKVGLYTDKINFQVSYEPWDGVERVSVYNGD